MGKSYEGKLSAEGLKFGIVVSRFNSLITDRLLDGAKDCLLRHGAAEKDLDVTRVPGSWEIPLAVKWMAESKRYDAVLALGCVIRGGTPHFDYVAAEVTKGSASVQLGAGVPVALGVLTTDTIEQAIERAGTKHGNKGWEAAMAAIEMAGLRSALGIDK
jgi:6,7-dimethyl-8-ribityllumazine synthase